MKIELNKNEIKQIIAEKYGIPVQNVKIYSKETTTGYGTGEHIEYVPVCTMEDDTIHLYKEIKK